MISLRRWLLLRCCCAFAIGIWIVVSILGGYPVKKNGHCDASVSLVVARLFYAVDMVLFECLSVARWLLTCYGCFPGCCYCCCCYYVDLWLLECSKCFGLGGC